MLYLENLLEPNSDQHRCSRTGTHSSLTKPGAYITHNAARPGVHSDILLCYASSGYELLALNRDEKRAAEV